MRIKEKYNVAIKPYKCDCALCRFSKQPALIKAGDKYMLRSIFLDRNTHRYGEQKEYSVKVKGQILTYRICEAHAVRIAGLT